MNILVRHSEAVSQKALSIAKAHPELEADLTFLEEAAMLHDIGIVKTDAPGIECYGTEPYICHGILGAAMLRDEGLPRHARVCERHTGAGLLCEDIIGQNLPLPHHDFLPETIEEPSSTVRKPCSRQNAAWPSMAKRGSCASAIGSRCLNSDTGFR